ncbi:MAG: dihydrodipicolinate synthase family protein [Rhodopirellula sp.]|nr:dihydrodipicolinate synthase family protein [Rhodopirellula sp.]
MVTPLLDRDTLDIAGLERLVEHILAGGVHGLFLLGTTGEGPSLSYRLRRELIERVCRQVDGRVPVLVGITDTSFVESVRLADHAADAGADALVLSTPYYHPIDAGSLLGYVERITEELPRPVVLYSIPSHTKAAFDRPTLARAMELPNVIGLKDSSADLIHFHHVLRLARQRSQWSVLMGPEELLAESVLLGGDGGVCGGANLYPRLYVDLFHAAEAGDLTTARQLHQCVLQVAGTLYAIDSRPGSVIKGLKCALACLGICRDTMAEPFESFAEAERNTVRRHLDEIARLMSINARTSETAR